MNTHKGNDLINQLFAGVSLGAVCVTLLPSKKNSWFGISEQEKIYDAIASYPQENTYLSLCIAAYPKSSFSRIGRNEANLMPGIVVDIDVFNIEAHTETNLPKSKKGALEFIRELPLPEPSAIIDTGNGYQCLWFLDKPFELKDEYAKKQAERLSFGFNKIIIDEGRKRGWKFDNVGDLGRIFRLPDTFNVKGSEPKRTFVYEMKAGRYNFDELMKLLPNEEVAEKSFQCFNKDVEFEGKSNLESVYRACRFIRRWVDDADELPEPEWYAGLSIVARTLNGIEQAHKISSSYAKYDEEETERKIRQALSASGPVTCKQINKLGFDGCLTCPLFYSKSLNSPITIGFYEPSLGELLGRYAYSIQTAQFAEVR